MAANAGDDMSTCVCLKRDVAAELGRNPWRRIPSPSLCFASAQAGSDPSGMGMKWIELSFRQRSVAQSKFYRNVVKPARCEAAIKMPHPRNDHPDNRDINVGACLIENEKIEALLRGQADAGGHLLARTEPADLRAKVRLDGRNFAWRQKGMVAQTQRSG